MEICKGMNQWKTPSCLPQIPKNEIWGRESRVLSPIFAFWKWGRNSGGQFPTESEFSEEKTFNFRISGAIINFL